MPVAPLAESTDRLLANFDARTLEILARRSLALGQKTTLQELGDRYSLTRERVRQIQEATEELLHERESRAENVAFRDASQKLAQQLGSVARSERLEKFERLFRESPLARHRELILPLLLWAGGPYERYGPFVVQSPADNLVNATTETLDSITRKGPAKASVAMAKLARLGVAPGAQESWVLHLNRHRFMNGFLVRWRGNLGDKAEAVLSTQNRPMTIEELAAQIGEQKNIRTLGNRLVTEARFCRTNPGYFALREWGMRGYSSIADALTDEIKRKGGKAGAEYLISTLTSHFNIAEGSIRSHLRSPRFARNSAGMIQAGSGKESYTPRKPVELAKRCFRALHGWAFRVAVDRDLMRGSGHQLPMSIAIEWGVQPMHALELQSSTGPILLSWRSLQPTLGSLRKAAKEIGASTGDYMFVEPLPHHRVSFRLVTGAELLRAKGIARLQLEIGLKPAKNDDAALVQVAHALGLNENEATIDDIRLRLRERREDDLLKFLPTEHRH